MADGSPPSTARRVAAYRLGFERPPTAYGDPDADDALARDVTEPDRSGDSDDMTRYLRGRTAFFDRVLAGAMDRQVTQVVSVGAGYDGRAFRFAKPGVRWWEVDHPDTQSDKLARIARLGIDASHVSFVGHDLRQPGLDQAVVSAGYDIAAAAIILCEGVAVYLDPTVLELLLEQLRLLATGGTRLALSLTGPSTSTERAARRARFEAAAAGLGETARNALTPADTAGMFAATGWRGVTISDRATAAGFVIAAPVWVPGSSDNAPTSSRPKGEPSTSVPSGTEVVRAFLPSRDFEESKAFYSALGFELTLDADVAIFRAGQSEFILTKYFQKEYAENSMMQLLVDDLDGWWSRIESLDLARRFGVRPPKAPALQDWGLRVAFVIDPAGVLWHFAQGPGGLDVVGGA